MTRFAFDLLFDASTFVLGSACVAVIGVGDVIGCGLMLLLIAGLIVCRHAADVRRTNERRRR